MKYSARNKINSLGAIRTFQVNRPSVFSNMLEEIEKPLAEIYGLGTVCENGIYPKVSVDFNADNIKKLLKYKTLGYSNVYLFEDGFGIILDTNKNSIDISSMDYVRSNLRIWHLNKPIRLKGLFMMGGRMPENKVTVTEFAELRNMHDQDLITDGLSDLNLLYSNNLSVHGTLKDNGIIHIVECKDCRLKIDDAFNMHIGLYDSENVELDIGKAGGTIRIACSPFPKTDNILLKADSIENFKDIVLTITDGLEAVVDKDDDSPKIIIKKGRDPGLTVSDKLKIRAIKLFGR